MVLGNDLVRELSFESVKLAQTIQHVLRGEIQDDKKHLLILSAITYTVFTRCSDSDPVRDQNSLGLQGGLLNSHKLSTLPNVYYNNFW